MSKKPPLGLMPQRIHDCKRISDILQAMQRFSYEETPIPPEWVGELKRLLQFYGFM